MVGFQKGQDPIVIYPRKDLPFRLSSEPLAKEQEHCVWNEQENEANHCSYKEWDMFVAEVSDGPIVEPHSHMGVVRIFQECIRKCSNNCAKEFSI